MESSSLQYTNMISEVSLELGGKSPQLIFESADLEQGWFHRNLILLSADLHNTFRVLLHRWSCTYPSSAAAWAALGICYNTGQDCTAGSRLYVQDTIYDKFIDILVSTVKATIIGDGFDEKSGGGPLVSKTQFQRVWGYIDSGKAEGAKVVLGGERRNTKGYFVDPTS